MFCGPGTYSGSVNINHMCVSCFFSSITQLNGNMVENELPCTPELQQDKFMLELFITLTTMY